MPKSVVAVAQPTSGLGLHFQAELKGVAWAGSTIYYQFPTSASLYQAGYGAEVSGFSPFTDGEASAADQILTELDEMLSVHFVRVAGNTPGPDANLIRFANTSSGNSGESGHAYFPNTTI